MICQLLYIYISSHIEYKHILDLVGDIALFFFFFQIRFETLTLLYMDAKERQMHIRLCHFLSQQNGLILYQSSFTAIREKEAHRLCTKIIVKTSIDVTYKRETMAKMLNFNVTSL
jgi:hypothetical protein